MLECDSPASVDVSFVEEWISPDLRRALKFRVLVVARDDRCLMRESAKKLADIVKETGAKIPGGGTRGGEEKKRKREKDHSVTKSKDT